MITIYCGDNSVASRKLFSEHLARDSQAHFVQSLAGGVTLDLLKETLGGGDSLFFESKSVFLENSLSKIALRNYLKDFQTSETHHIIIWEERYSDRDIKKYMPKAQIYASSLPTTIWSFLDSIYPANLQRVLKTHMELAQAVEEPIVMYMLVQRMKELILVHNNLPGKAPKADWQKRRLLEQARRWNQDRLLQFHRKLCEIDINIKTGQLPYSSKKALDILFCFYVQ